jgi:hypothetical protein
MFADGKRDIAKNVVIGIEFQIFVPKAKKKAIFKSCNSIPSEEKIVLHNKIDRLQMFVSICLFSEFVTVLVSLVL